MLRRVAVVLAVFLLTVSCGGESGPSLVGVWVGTETGGGGEQWTFTFNATDFSAESAGVELYQGTYDAFANEDPKRMVSTITGSKFPQFVGESPNTIYRLDGDTLILAANEPGVPETPAGFDPGGGTRVWELTRQ